MDLDDMKNKWEVMDKFSEEKLSIPSLEKITHKKKITSKKYSKNMAKIAMIELVFSLLYLYLLFFFIHFNQHYISATHVVLSYSAIVLVIALPILSLSNIYLFYRTGKLLQPYNETLKLFKQQCERFNRLQYLIATLNISLLFMCLILIPKVYTEHLSTDQLVVSFVLGSLLALWFSRKIWTYYRKQIKRNEALIKKLGQD